MLGGGGGAGRRGVTTDRVKELWLRKEMPFLSGKFTFLEARTKQCL